MKTDENKAIVRRLFEEMITQGELAIAEEIFAPDFFWPQFGLRGPEGAKQWVRTFRTAFPDVLDAVEEQIAEGDMVMTRVMVRGTNLGAWYGMPPTGKVAVFPAVGIDRLVDGKIVERFAIFDLAGVLRQLGHEGLSPSSSPGTWSTS